MECLFFTVAEVADLLGITERSVYRLKDKVPGYVKVGGLVRYRKTTFMRATQGTEEPAGMVSPISDRHGLT